MTANLQRLGLLFCLLILSIGPTFATTTPVELAIPRGANDPGTCTDSDPPGCEDKALFTTSSFDTSYGRWIYFSANNARLLYNVQYDSDGNGSLDAWRFATSKAAVDLTSLDPGATLAVGWVHAKTNPTFYNPADGQTYRRVMYFVFQEAPPTPVAGRVCLSYSNSTGATNDWTPPIAAIFSTTSPTLRGRPCNVQNAEVPVEAISGFQQADGSMALFALHGNLALLEAAIGTTRTETYYLETTPSAPDVIQVQGMVTSAGMQAPTSPGGDADYFFRNLDASYDAPSGKVYLSRATPYPFDIDDGSIPCAPDEDDTMVCNGDTATLPLRGQIYSMTVGKNIQFTISPSNSWQLELDMGDDVGWGIDLGNGGGCFLYPTSQVFQQDFGIDVDSLTLHKTMSGHLDKAGSDLQIYLGGWPAAIDRKESCSTSSKLSGTWRDATLFEMLYTP